ncbi:MAG: hypothetical protein S4CHLAM2_09530 [Chlamydiales bacterium]|nr:hypothetical protein [Chlamydiales bacterium]
MTDVCSLTAKLQEHLKIDVELVINENRSTMLSILEKRRNRARLSIHKMFIDAPDEVIGAVAHYVRGTRRNGGGHNSVLRGFIQENLPRFDVSNRLDSTRLVQAGRVYDLNPLYRQINQHYFEGELELALTWYGNWGRNSRRRVTFGLYQENLKLVKMHRILDDLFFPEYFVAFVLYHEMLHAVVPGYKDEWGYFRVHGPAFKERERLFEHYEQAIAWEKKNKKHFFRS